MGRFLPQFGLAPFVCLFLAVGALTLGELSEEKMSQSRKAQRLYTQALGDTRGLLASLVHHLGSDPTLQQNIDAKLGNSLQGNLTASLSHGQLEQLVLFDQRCEEITRANLQKLPSYPCDKAQAGDGFYWSTSAEGAPVLSFAHTMQASAEARVLVLGQVALSQDWLLLYPRLAHAVTELSLRLASSQASPPPQGKILLREGQVAEGEYAAALWSEDWLAGGQAPLLQQAELFKYGFFWPFLLAAVSLWAARAWNTRRARRRQDELALAFTEQCQKLFQFDSLAFHYDVAADPRFAGAEPYSSVLSRLVSGLQAQQAKCEQLHREVARQEALAQRLQQRYQQLQAQAASLSEHDALALHIKQAALPFMNKLKKQAATQHNIAQVVQYGLRQDGKAMAELIDQWRVGLQTKGARKFIRSLSETPTPQAGLDNQLEYELGELLEVGGRLTDQALHVARLVQAFEREQDQALRVVAHWYSLALREDQGEARGGKLPLKALLAQAEELRQQQDDACRLNLNLQAEDSDGPLPAVPSPVLVAACCHILTALSYAHLAAKADKLLVVRRKQLGDEQYLLFTLAQGELLPEEAVCQGGWKHAEMANRLLAPYQASFQALPAQRQFSTFALVWKPLAAESSVQRRDGAAAGAVELGKRI